MSTLNVDLRVCRIVRLGVDTDQKVLAVIQEFLAMHCYHHAFELEVHCQHYVHCNTTHRVFTSTALCHCHAVPSVPLFPGLAIGVGNRGGQGGHVRAPPPKKKSGNIFFGQLLGRPEQPFRTGFCFTADVFFFFATLSQRSLDRSP